MTQTSKWTPGVWYGAGLQVRSNSRNQWLIADVYGDGDAEAMANVKLMAAAPDLFIALATVLANHHLDYLDKDFESIPYVIDARRALDKARGEA